MPAKKSAACSAQFPCGVYRILGCRHIQSNPLTASKSRYREKVCPITYVTTDANKGFITYSQRFFSSSIPSLSRLLTIHHQLRFLTTTRLYIRDGKASTGNAGCCQLRPYSRIYDLRPCPGHFLILPSWSVSRAIPITPSLTSLQFLHDAAVTL